MTKLNKLQHVRRYQIVSSIYKTRVRIGKNYRDNTDSGGAGGDSEGDGSEDVDDDDDDDSGGVGSKQKPKNKPYRKTFTQKQLDDIVKKRLTKVQKQLDTTTSSLRTLEQSSSITQEERDELSAQLEDLATQNMTAAEQAARRQKQLTDKHTKDMEKLTGERDGWKDHFHKQVIQTQLLKAADDSYAESSDQIRQMYAASCFLEELKDDSGKTVDFVGKLRFEGINEDTKQLEEMELPIVEAISKIKLDGRNKNLFKHTSRGGTGVPADGKGSNKGTGMPDRSNYPDTAEGSKQYMQIYNNYLKKGA